MRKTIVFIIFLFTTSLLTGQTYVKNLSIRDIVTIGEVSYMVAANSETGNGYNIWKTDGTQEGTILVKDINKFGSANIKNLTVFNNEVYFSANDGFHGDEIWKTDGTPEGTIMIKDIHGRIESGSRPNEFVVFNGFLYFAASDNYGPGIYQLWKTDGTEVGTVKVYDGGTKKISKVFSANNKLYILSNELFEISGDTGRLSPITIDDFPFISNFNTFNNELYFITSDLSYKSQIRLYKLDDSGMPILLKEFFRPQHGFIEIHNFTLVDGNVYFSITTDYDTQEDTDVLWKSSGTPEGTVSIKSFEWDRHWSRSNISNFIEYNNKLFFNGGSQNDFSLWTSDGTDNGTKKVADVNLQNSVPFLIFKDLLYFTSFTSNNLWSTDGTSENTKRISDLSIPIRKSNDYDYFDLRSTPEFIFLEANYQSESTLFSMEPNPILNVKGNGSLIKNEDEIYLRSKIDSVIEFDVMISNIGDSPLNFSNIEVVGKDYYLNEENFPQSIEPKENANFSIALYPSSKGLKNASLKIISNDIENPYFELNLTGFVSDETGDSPVETIQLKKKIDFKSDTQELIIDNNAVFEKSPLNSEIGNFSILNPSESFTYELTPVENENDNSSFTIEGSQLRSNSIFDYDLKTTYLVSVKATGKNSGNVILQNIVIEIQNVNDTIIDGSCDININNLSYGFRDVEFIDGSKAIAVGDHGVIVKSEDGGVNWNKVKNGNYNHLKNVVFPNELIGYAVGEKELFKTVDGGDSWFSIQIPKQILSLVQLENLFFINSEIGFAFGRKGNIIKTTDGGQSWNHYKMYSKVFNAASFPNQEKGFIVGNYKTLMQTLNGGNTWENINIEGLVLERNTHFRDIQFVNDQIGYIAGNNGQIIKTIDGGNSWAVLPKLQMWGTSNRVKFVNENVGYLLGSELYKTVDSGNSWELEPLEYVYSNLMSVDISDDGEYACMVGTGGSGHGQIIHTKKTNEDWKISSYLSTDSSDIVSVSFEGEQGILLDRAYDGDSRLFLTKNKGVTWQLIQPPDIHLRQVKFINNKIYLLSSDNLYYSFDFGKTWETLLNIDTNSFKKFQVINDNLIFAIQQQYFSRSEDGGKTWSNFNIGNHLQGLHFPDEKTGVVYGIPGLYKTDNGKSGWRNLPIEEAVEEDLYVSSVFFYDRNIGMAGSTVGLLKTIDGGENWELIDKNVGGEVTFIHAKSELEWYIVAGGQRILKTLDGGLSWESLHYDREVLGVDFKDDRAYFVGAKYFVEMEFEPNLDTPSEILGANVITSLMKETYSVYENNNVKYRWEVSGDNEIIYSRNKADVYWNEPGNHTITVTPYNGCNEGPSRELTVVVREVSLSPVITGDFEVFEYSMYKDYSTPFNENSRYHWIVAGAVSFHTEKNKISVNWGSAGIGQVKVMETDVETGLRKNAVSNIGIKGFVVLEDNFTIEVIGESCPNKNNGQIHIEATETLNYVVTINETSYDFSSNLSIENLTPSTYNLCISIPSKAYEQCYTLEIKESSVLTGKSTLDKEKITVNLTGGTSPFNIFVNGESRFQTESDQFDLSVNEGDQIEITSNKICEGVFKKKVGYISDYTILPNPTEGVFQILIPGEEKIVQVQLFSTQSQLISSSFYNVENGKIKIDIQNKSSGVYYVKIGETEPATLKVIKK